VVLLVQLPPLAVVAVAAVEAVMPLLARVHLLLRNSNAQRHKQSLGCVKAPSLF
jgi:hypothetical protein